MIIWEDFWATCLVAVLGTYTCLVIAVSLGGAKDMVRLWKNSFQNPDGRESDSPIDSE